VQTVVAGAVNRWVIARIPIPSDAAGRIVPVGPIDPFGGCLKIGYFLMFWITD